MGDIVLAGATSGTITLQPTAVAGSNTLTLPAANATVLTSASPASSLPSSINGPTFSAYLIGSSQSVTSGVNTVATLNTEEWDVGGCFNNTGSTVTLNGLSVPAYAFCPNVAGYYQVSGMLRYVSSGNFTAALSNFNLNGGIYYRWFELTTGSYTSGWSTNGSLLIYLNGTGDYVQLAGQVSGTSPAFENAGTQYTSRLQAVLVRSA